MRNLSWLLAIVIVVVSGVIHGLIVHRWEPGPDVTGFVASLDRIPMKLGSWKAVETKIPERHLQIGEIDGYLSRVYTNQENGSRINLMIVCGSPGPISVHTPDICFRGVGYELRDDPQQHSIGSEQDPSFAVEAFFADFSKTDSIMPHNLRVVWMWCDGESFYAPDNPRISFADRSFLYKIYLTQVNDHAGVPLEKDECVSFFKIAGPVLQREFCSKRDSADTSQRVSS